MSAQTDKDEKKKGAAPVPLGAGGSGASFSLEQLESLQFTLSQTGASAGAAGGAASAGAAIASKVILIMAVSMLGVGAANMSRRTQLDKPSLNRSGAAPEKPKYEGDLSNLPSKPQDQPALQDVVLGDMARKGDADDAAAKAAADAEAAAAAAKAKVGQDEKDKDEAGKAMKAAASATPAMAAGDLTAKAAKIPQGKKTFDKTFGQLSSSLGGGSGLSGGIGGSFQRPLTASAASGQSKGMGQAPAKKGGGAQAIGSGGRSGRAFRQLVAANGASRAAAKAGTADGAGSTASGAFDNNRAGGSAITGGGAGITGAGVFIPGGDKSPGGNPINSSGADGTKAPPAAQGKNVTPWQKFVDIAMIALLVAGLLMGLAYLFAQAAKKTGAAAWLATAAQVCAYGAIAMGSLAAVMGAIVMGMGQTMQGLMFVGAGALIDVLAIMQLTSDKDQSEGAKDQVTKDANSANGQAPGQGTKFYGGPETKASSWEFHPSEQTGFHIDNFGGEVFHSEPYYCPAGE